MTSSGPGMPWAVDSGERVGYRWDAVGRLAQVTDPQGAATTYRYDAAGRRSGVTYGNGTTATYAYDGVGQVLSIAYADPTGAVETAFGYEYDTAGNRKHKRFADGSPLLPKGVVPPGGMTLYATWSWILKGWGQGCKC